MRMLNYFFLNKFLLILVLVLLYYFLFKYILKKMIYGFDCFDKIKKRASFDDYFGALEMLFLSLSHFLLCAIVVFLFEYDFVKILNADAWAVLFSTALGVSLFGFSNLICQIYICIAKRITPLKAPLEVKSWLAMSKSGWIKHHFQCIKVFPVFVWLAIISLQVACEEFIFRGFLLNYFLEFGQCVSILLSTALFILVQSFSMPNLISAAFPMIGALVMGIIHALLFLKTQQIIPLMISHVSFFIFVLITQES